MTKYEVQKNRTVTCLQGTVHEGGKLSIASFSGNDDEARQGIIDALVDIGALIAVPLTDAEKEALAEAGKAEKAIEDEKAKKEVAILSADFDSMNKDPMIEFAKEWEIELKETKAEDIRAELNLLKESLKSL